MDDLRALLLRPGDGSGWSALIGDRYTYGTLDAVVARLAAHAGPHTPTEPR